jgi:putative transposase
MARLACIVIPGLPHHITQRGNRREQVFFSDADYLARIDMIAAARRTSEADRSAKRAESNR